MRNARRNGRWLGLGQQETEPTAGIAQGAGDGWTEFGWTAVACLPPSCCPILRSVALEKLRAVVGTCPDAVLIRAESVPPMVSGTALGRGFVLLVQRCTVGDRRPVGGALVVGPMYSADDVDTACRWLVIGRGDPSALPERLRRSASVAKAPLN